MNTPQTLHQATQPTGPTVHLRTIPSLDGLRAFSILLVILAHYVVVFPGTRALEPYFFELGQAGVAMFFVISGFLITFLLLKEFHAKGTVDLKRFYFRRTCRIFPPFYAYLAVIGLLWWTGTFPQDPASFVAAATYTWNYYPAASGGLLAHTWSLSLEEQFYLLWPFTIAFLKPRTSAYIAGTAIMLTPLSRLATYFFFPVLRGGGKISQMLHTRVDTIMFGCLLALLWRNDTFQGCVKKYLRPWVFLVCMVFSLIVGPLLNLKLRGIFHFFYFSLMGLALSGVLLYSIRFPESSAGNLLNTRILRYIGVISYSLYLWQQLFDNLFLNLFPLNLAAAFLCAVASYYFVERPVLKWRDNFDKSKF